MPEHMSSKLNAFLDGELDQRAQSDVLAHLETCQPCAEALEELRRVSRILQAAPQPKFTPAESFKERLMLQLPSRDEAQPETPHAAHQMLWMVPVAALAGWLFMQVTLNLSGLITLAGQVGIMEGALAWAAGNPQQTRWFAAAQAAVEGILGMQMPAGLGFLNGAGVFANSLVTPLLWQAGAAALYWAALALVWRGRVNALQASSMLE